MERHVMSGGKYTNDAQQRLLRLVFALFEDVVNGYPPAALAKMVDAAPPAITRDLDNLLTFGLVERVESTGHWRLTARLPQQCFKVMNAIDRHERRLEEVRARFTRDPG